MSQKKLTEMRRKAVVVAVAAALPVMMAGNVYADCTGTAGMATSPQIRCNNNNDDGAAANVTVSDTSTYVDQTNAGGTTYATGGSILLQFDGHGRTLTVNQNALLANYRNVDNTRTAVTMGASTTNASASTVFATQTLGSSVNLLGANGSTVVATVNSGTTINLPGNTAVTLTYGSGTTGTLVKLNTGTLTNSLVGQSLVFGRWDASDSDFVPGESYKIVAYDATNRLLLVEGTLSSNFAGPGSSSLPLVYSIVSNYGQGTNKSFTGNAAALFGSSHFYNNVVNNAGTIASRLQPSELSTSDTSPAAPYNSAIYGIRTSVAGDYLIDNAATGVIKVTHAGIGNAYAIEEGGTVLRLDIRNAGLIEAERTQALTPVAVTATGNPTATSAGLNFTATTLGLANAVNTQEEAEVLNVYNASTGIIRSKGDYSGTFYMRAGEKNIVNDGLIEHLSNAAAVASASTFANMSNAEKYGKGFAIGSVSNGGEIRELNLTNNGTIHGDILAVNGNALRWYLLSTVGDTTSNTLGSAAAITAGLNSRLTINSHTGQENSNITNNGTIIGNIWLSNGEHELENSGTLTGNIDVDQRDTTYGTASGTLTLIKREDGTASNNTVQGSGYIIRGDKRFTFENTGTFTGNLNITNASSSYSNATFGLATNLSGTVSSDNVIENSGTFTGNISITDVSGAKNEITLSGDGFTGNITATSGAGNNILNLQGTGTLRGNVAKFTTLNLGAPGSGGGGGDDDADAGAPNW
ncbi:MAG: hypothetical protein N2Z69_01290, partial [Methylophilaceae bacterium]|nr:hypothetical protein [Methylophilaceae bacterium]